jgi:ABC-type thiamine transport system ATPase subunit
VGGLFHYFLRPAMSASGGTKQNIAFAKADVRYWPILLKKSFCITEHKF